MEVEEMQTQECNFTRIGNNRNGKKESGPKAEEHEQYQDEEEGDGEVKRGDETTGVAGGMGRGDHINGRVDSTNPSGLGRLYNWPSSRIVRVSRASGGKDRHSKVWTSKGLRDRRVRLSVPTAIQFYDLQDRLGYDQPSKAVEWLLTAAATSIAELPSISSPFSDTPQQLTDAIGRHFSGDNEPRFDLDQDEDADDGNMLLQQQQDGNGSKALSKSACSSTSETSKGSGLSFSRSESRIKARERARERAAEKEKEKENEGCRMGSRNLDPISQNSSFTELLTGGTHIRQNDNNHSPDGNGSNNGNGNAYESNLFQKSSREWASTSSMDYFATGFLNLSTTRPVSSGSNFFGLENHPLQQPVASPVFTITADQTHQELPHFSFLPDHLVPMVPVRAGSGNCSNNNNNGDYNLNFCVSSSSSSGLAGFNRGTLQSNSSVLPHLQRFPTTTDGPSAFFISTASPVTNAAVVAPVENQYHHFLSGFDPQLQLCYDATGRHHDHKGKGKN